MPTPTKRTVRISALLVALFVATGAPADDRGPGTSLGFHVGYFAPVGDWNAHRYAPGVDQFQGGFTFGGELELRIFSFHLGIFADYMRLSTKQWEDYAQGQGDEVVASGAMNDVGARLKFYLARRGPDLMNLSLGFVAVGMSGKESFAGRTYDYDFLRGGGGFVLGIQYKRVLSPHLALTAEVRALFVIEGIKYADGEVRDVTGLPLTLGLTYLF
jgi:hypothetical protein